MQVAREQRGVPDVVGLDQPRGPAFQPDGKTAVRRHAVAESIQAELVWLGRFAPIGERALVVRVLLQPLAPGDQLQATEDQIEGVRPVRGGRPIRRGGALCRARLPGSARPRPCRCGRAGPGPTPGTGSGARPCRGPARRRARHDQLVTAAQLLQAPVHSGWRASFPNAMVPDTTSGRS